MKRTQYVQLINLIALVQGLIAMTTVIPVLMAVIFKYTLNHVWLAVSVFAIAATSAINAVAHEKAIR